MNEFCVNEQKDRINVSTKGRKEVTGILNPQKKKNQYIRGSNGTLTYKLRIWFIKKF